MDLDVLGEAAALTAATPFGAALNSLVRRLTSSLVPLRTPLETHDGDDGHPGGARGAHGGGGRGGGGEDGGGADADADADAAEKLEGAGVSGESMAAWMRVVARALNAQPA
uniref:Uncharacterized protein n=2 Tax=Chrysotila carterae TaxID=13221 RepID=A0A7S4EZM1_CHRCT